MSFNRRIALSIFRLTICLLVTFFSVEAYRVDAHVAGFVPESSLFRDIYGDVHPEYQLEFSFPLQFSIEGWVNVGYLYASGSSVPLNNSSQLHIVPVSAGIKYVYPLDCCWNVYLDVGALWAWLYEKNNFDLCPINNHENGFGGIGKLGIERCFCHRIVAGIFVDYRLLHFHGDHEAVHLNGLYFGGSLGYQF